MGLRFVTGTELFSENRDWARAVPGTTISGYQNAFDPGAGNVNVFWELTTDNPGESRVAVTRSREAGDALKIFARVDGGQLFILEVPWPGAGFLAVVADWTTGVLAAFDRDGSLGSELTDWAGPSSDTDSAFVSFGGGVGGSGDGSEQHDLRLWRRALGAAEISCAASPRPRTVPDYFLPMVFPVQGGVVPSLGRVPTAPIDLVDPDGDVTASLWPSSLRGTT
jgi:hypothetical protein